MSTQVGPSDASSAPLLTLARKLEAGRIAVVGILTALYWQGLVPPAALVLTLGLGLYPLAKAGLRDLWIERRVGTELFVTVATVIAFLGREYVAAAVLMTIILIAEYIADFNTDRARASIKALVGATPRTATLKTSAGERTVPIDELTVGAVVLVRAGDRVPVDGTVVNGTATVNEASITGESVPVERARRARYWPAPSSKLAPSTSRRRRSARILFSHAS